MEIKRILVPAMTLEEFADINGLVLKVKERSSETVSMVHVGENRRFYAMFEDSEIKEDCTLRGGFGDGATEEQAILNYAKEISEKMLVINAFDSDKRREIGVPRIIGIMNQDNGE